MRRLPLILGIAALVTGLATLVGSAAPFGAAQKAGSASQTEVKIDNFSFTPNTLTVSAGTTVRWTNRDDIPHTVVSDDNTFKSNALDTDDVFSFKFTKPGSYSYFCSLHPKMTGKIVVQ